LRIVGLAQNHAAAEQLQEAQHFDSSVRELNISSTIFANLPKKLDAMSNVIQSAVQSFEQLEAAARKAGVEFDGTSSAIEKLRLVLSLAESAPTDILYLRHEGLRHPYAHAALSAAGRTKAEIQAKQTALNSELYLDMTPPECDLKSAIFVLREGDAWYRIFQGKWRRATGLHKQLQRNKEKKPAAARLSQLEEVLSTIQSYDAWRNDADLRFSQGPASKTWEHRLQPLLGSLRGLITQ